MARHAFFLTEIIRNIKFSENLPHVKLITLLVTKQDQNILVTLAICQQLANTLGNLGHFFFLVDHFPNLQGMLILLSYRLIYRTKVMTALQKTTNTRKRKIALLVCRHVVGYHLIGLSQSPQEIHWGLINIAINKIGLISFLTSIGPHYNLVALVVQECNQSLLLSRETGKTINDQNCVTQGLIQMSWGNFLKEGTKLWLIVKISCQQEVLSCTENPYQILLFFNLIQML